MKEIKIFDNDNKYLLEEEVNEFIKNTEYEVLDIKYSVCRGLFSTVYSAMVILEASK